jgi:hypothetical protein
MRIVLSLVLIWGVMAALTTPASAAVLCKTRMGVIVVREACKKKEAPLDLSQFGAIGPAGPAGLAAWERPCPPDAVLSGTTCIDKFEASVWRISDSMTTNSGLVAKIQQGTVTVADLTAGDATPLGAGSDNYAPCGDSGQDCAHDIYAVSVPGVMPSAFLTWFQAQVACKNARKRLPSNAEWQAAVAGTPDPGPDNGTTDCDSTGVPSLTGSRSNCVSADGAFDMVGNRYEFVEEWIPKTWGCQTWSGEFSSDQQCLSANGPPVALMRGGFAGNEVGLAGPLAVNTLEVSDPNFAVGFRCAR